MLPNAVVVGQPKCGTTSLFRWFADRPDCFTPARKELHFFSAGSLSQNDRGPGDRNAMRSVVRDWREYQRLYERAANETVVLDVSPSYLYWRQAEPIAEKLGENTKILVCLRDPVVKTYSQWQHLVREGRERLPFERALATEQRRIDGRYSDLWRYVSSSLTAEPLESFVDVFSIRNIHAFVLDSYLQDPDGELAALCRFLNIPYEHGDRLPSLNRAVGRPRNAFLARAANWDPTRRAAATWFPSRTHDSVRRGRNLLINRAPTAVDRMPEETRARLRDKFREDSSAVSRILARTLPWAEGGCT